MTLHIKKEPLFKQNKDFRKFKRINNKNKRKRRRRKRKKKG